MALWPTSLLADVAGLWRGEPLWWALSFWCLALGLVVAVAAMTAGLVDYTALPKDHPSLSVATLHLVFMTSATFLFLVSLLVRRGPGDLAPPLALVAPGISLLGAAVLAVGGWLGGSLVYRHGVGCDIGRHG